MKYSKDRSFLINALFFILCIVGLFIGPTIISAMLKNIFKNATLINILSDVIFIVLLYLMYYKDLNKEAKTFYKNFKTSLFTGLKYYYIGLLGMILSNLIISFIISGMSNNESVVRNMLFEKPILTMLSIVIIAPISEELIFRKSLEPLIKNKWVYATICGLLFGAAHLLAGDFKLIYLLYLIPYGSLGFAFALMDYETKSTFTSITMHALHNCLTGVALLIFYYLGAL